MAITNATLIASIAGTAVVAVGLTAGSVWAIRSSGRDFWGNTESTITLRQPGGGACTITGKETEVSVKKNKKLTWKVVSYCATAQTVSLGNFRITAAGAQTNCTGATEGGATWPFQGADGAADRQVTVEPTDCMFSATALTAADGPKAPSSGTRPSAPPGKSPRKR